jgi:predicted cupin superfamily sugar epimerase
MSLSPDQVIELLGLQAHPTCGFARETYRSGLQIPAGALPPSTAAAGRWAGSSTSS